MFEKEIAFIKDLYPQTKSIPLHEPCFIGREKELLSDTIDSTFVSSVGKYVDQFEQMICSFTKAPFACAIVNGTAALHVSLVASGVQYGDEVLTQPLTFVATANAISYCGAEPVFLDVDKYNLGLSAKALEQFLDKHVKVENEIAYNIETGKKIAACLPVHIYGHPCEIDRIVEICDAYHIPVVEDCAESLGALFKRRHTGLFGRCGAISFNGNKIVTAGGGGAIITKDKDLAKKIKHISTTARVSAENGGFVHDEIGYNYRMPNINAALACAQMENLPLFIEKKRRLAAIYQDLFKNSVLEYFLEPVDSRSNYWLNVVAARDQQMHDIFLNESNDAGIMSRPVWQLMHKLSMYKFCQKDTLTNALWLEERLVNIPSSVIL